MQHIFLFRWLKETGWNHFNIKGKSFADINWILERIDLLIFFLFYWISCYFTPCLLGFHWDLRLWITEFGFVDCSSEWHNFFNASIFKRLMESNYQDLFHILVNRIEQSGSKKDLNGTMEFFFTLFPGARILTKSIYPTSQIIQMPFSFKLPGKSTHSKKSV